MIGLVGNLNIDLILYHLNEQPKFGSEYVMESSVQRPGGLANVLLPLSELGEKPLVVSLLGNDYYGDLVYDELQPKIVDGIKRTNSETSLSIGVVNQSSERFFLTQFGNLTEFTYDTVKSAKQLPKCSAVMFYGYFLLPNFGHDGTMKALIDAKKQGRRLSWTPIPILVAGTMSGYRKYWICCRILIISCPMKKRRLT